MNNWMSIINSINNSTNLSGELATAFCWAHCLIMFRGELIG